MLTIKNIKETCIEIDLQNLGTIGMPSGDDWLTFNTENEVRLFYAQIGLKELLKIYSSYCGLEDYSKDDYEDYLRSFSIDILEIINNL